MMNYVGMTSILYTEGNRLSSSEVEGGWRQTRHIAPNVVLCFRYFVFERP